MTRFRLWTGLILVLILGALSGSLGTGLYYKKRIERFSEYGHTARSHLLMKRLSEELNLTEEQKAGIEATIDQFLSKLSSIKRKIDPELENLRDHTFGEIRTILTDGQKKEFDALRARLKHWRPEDRLQAMLARITPEGMIDEMKNRLGLTDSQVSKVRPIIENSLKEQRKILERYRKQDRRDGHSLRHELREHHISIEEKLSKVLTAGQLVEFRKLLAGQRRKMPPRRPAGSE